VAIIVTLRGCGAAFLQQITAISMSKSLTHDSDDQKTGWLLSAGSVHVLGEGSREVKQSQERMTGRSTTGEGKDETNPKKDTSRLAQG
jgi:hypothetical protein